VSWRLHRFKSRQRVAIRLALGVVVLMCLGAWITVQAVQRELRGDIDDKLRANATEITPIIQSISPEAMPEISSLVQRFRVGLEDDWTLVVRTPGADPIVLGSDEPIPDVVEAPLDELRGRAGEPFTTDATDGTDDAFRVLVTAIADGRVAVFASPLEDVHAVMGILHKTFLIGTVISVLALGALVWAVSRHVLKPLEDVVETAHAIGAGNLDLRVDVDCSAPDVERLRDALNKMLDRLQTAFARQERSEARLRQFVANASHELRTPLAAILGHAELYHEQMASSPDEIERVMRHITAEGTRMRSLVEDLLLLARLDEGRPLARDAVDLTAVVEEAVTAMGTLDGDHPVVVDAEPVEVIGDQQALRQVLDNLLTNVVVHTPPGTTATVRLRALDTPEGAAVGAELVVSDDGPGMDPEMAERVFERFVRAEQSRARPDGALGGSGLGLSIVEELVRAHGGTVTLTTSPGAGATFTVRLPAERVRIPVPAPA
jgi:two-component system OmpR family sensor kinase